MTNETDVKNKNDNSNNNNNNNNSNNNNYNNNNNNKKINALEFIEVIINTINHVLIGSITLFLCYLCYKSGYSKLTLHVLFLTIGVSFTRLFFFVKIHVLYLLIIYRRSNFKVKENEYYVFFKPHSKTNCLFIFFL